MGFYVNPPAEDKATALHGKSKWLEENGVKLDEPPQWSDIPHDCCAVCCVDNGPFEAAAIADKPSELAYFQSPDHRPKKWFIIEKKLAVEHSDVTMEDFA